MIVTVINKTICCVSMFYQTATNSCKSHWSALGLASSALVSKLVTVVDAGRASLLQVVGMFDSCDDGVGMVYQK